MHVCKVEAAGGLGKEGACFVFAVLGVWLSTLAATLESKVYTGKVCTMAGSKPRLCARRRSCATTGSAGIGRLQGKEPNFQPTFQGLRRKRLGTCSLISPSIVTLTNSRQDTDMAGA